MGLDVRGMIAIGDSVRAALAPNIDLFSGDPERDRAIATLSFVSSRREYWETFSCLIGYTEMLQVDPSNFLKKAHGEHFLSRDPDSEEGKFIHYCAQHLESMPIDILVGSIYSSSLVLKWMPPFQTTALYDVSECIAINTDENRITDWPAVRRCLKRSD